MIELRNKRQGNSGSFSGYKNPTLVISPKAKGRTDFYLFSFKEVDLITEKTHVMFGVKDGELYIWPEQQKGDNYILKKATSGHHLRFTSKRLYDHLVETLEIPKGVLKYELQYPRLEGCKYKLKLITGNDEREM